MQPARGEKFEPRTRGRRRRLSLSAARNYNNAIRAIQRDGVVVLYPVLDKLAFASSACTYSGTGTGC